MQACDWHLCHKETESRFCSRQCKSKHYVARRRSKSQSVAHIYKGGKCLVCEYQGPSLVYDFHHLDSNEKDHSVSSMWTKSWDRLREELDKCVMLCPICHRLHHGGLLDLTTHISKNPSPEEGLLLVKKSGITLPSVRKTSKVTSKCEICGVLTAGYSNNCKSCAARLSPTKIEWPPVEELRDRLTRTSFEGLARDLGVSSNAVRKRLKTYG